MSGPNHRGGGSQCALREVDHALDALEDEVLAVLNCEDRRTHHGLLAQIGAGSQPAWSVDDG